jgi:ABC-2 type transport system permease protein
MKLYVQIFKYYASTFGVYPFELVAWVLKRVIPIFFTILLWVAILNSGDELKLSLNQLTSYYILAAGISIVLMVRYGRFAKELLMVVKEGRLNEYLLKPSNTLLHIYAQSIGIHIPTILTGSLFILAGLIFAKPASPLHILLFLLSLVSGLGVSFAWNVLEGGLLSLWFTDPGGARNVANHFVAFLSGLLVPLSLLPELAERILVLLPFSALTYTPITILQAEEITTEIFLLLLVSIFWAISINIIIYILWKRALKKYEGVGI